MEIQEIIQRVDELKAEIDALRPISPEQEQRIMQKFRLDWTFHSNAIEGNSLTYGETRAFLLYGVTAQGKPFKDYLDIKGHHQALDYLVEFVRQEQPLTEAIIREIHEIILVEPYKIRAQTVDGQPIERTVQIGQYKSMPNHVVTPTGEVHYYATPEETPARMGDLMAWYRREQGKLHPLILAATFHYEFVAIHPFDDGNGRMARLLMNLILMQAGYPPVIVRLDNRPEYYLALAQADAGDLDNFITLVGNLLIYSLQLFLRGAKGETIEELTDLDKKLALLQKQLQADESTRPEKTPESLHQLYDTFLGSFLSHLLMQLAKFDRFFAHTHITPRTAQDSIKVYIEKWGMVSNETAFAYEWRDFIADEKFSLSFWFHIRLDKFSFVLSYGFDNQYLKTPFPFEWPDFLESLWYKPKKQLLTGRYDTIYSQEDTPILVQRITDEIYAEIGEFATK